MSTLPHKNQRKLLRWPTPMAVRIGAFVAILLLGTLGFQHGRPWAEFVDSVYRSLQLFAIAYDPPGRGWQINMAVEVARFLAPALLVVTVLNHLSLSFREWLGVQRQCLAARFFGMERWVLLGFGPVNRAYARRLDRPGHLVTAVARELSDADQAFARDHGVLLVAGDLSDRKTLERVALDRARKVSIACGDDAINEQIAALAAGVCEGRLSKRLDGCASDGSRRGHACDQEGNVIVQVHIGSYARMLAVNDGLDHARASLGGFRAFSAFGEAALQLVQRARFAERARDLGQKRVHVVIVGVGDLGEALLVETLLNVVDPENKPIITLVDKNIDAARSRLLVFYPRLFDDTLPAEVKPDIRFVSGTAFEVAAEGKPCGEELEKTETPPTAWIFACPLDETNSTAALILERAMQRLDRRPVPIHARVWDRLPLVVSETGDRGGAVGQLTTTFGDVWTTIDRGLQLRKELEHYALAIHRGYLGDKAAIRFAEDPHAFEMLWEALPENARRSNRTAARHLVEKLRALGFDWRGRGEGRLPSVPADAPIRDALDAQKAEGIADPALRRLAETEHARWMIERALSGWRGVAEKADRNNRRRLHNDMQSFQALHREDQNLDLTALRVAVETETKGAPMAFARKVHAFPLRELLVPASIDGAESVTELELTIDADDMPMSSAERERIQTRLRSWAIQPALARMHIRVIGERDLKMTLPKKNKAAGSAGDSLEEDGHPNLNIARWLDEIAVDVPGEMLFDVTYQAHPTPS